MVFFYYVNRADILQTNKMGLDSPDAAVAMTSLHSAANMREADDLTHSKMIYRANRRV